MLKTALKNPRQLAEILKRMHEDVEKCEQKRKAEGSGKGVQG